MFKKNIQVQSGCDLNLIHIRVPQEDYKGKLLGKQLYILYQFTIDQFQDAKSTRKSVQVKSGNEFQEDSNIAHESSSQDEVKLQFQPSTSLI